MFFINSEWLVVQYLNTPRMLLNCLITNSTKATSTADTGRHKPLKLSIYHPIIRLLAIPTIPNHTIHTDTSGMRLVAQAVEVLETVLSTI
jgi:hypothetical protein